MSTKIVKPLYNTSGRLHSAQGFAKRGKRGIFRRTAVHICRCINFQVLNLTTKGNEIFVPEKTQTPTKTAKPHYNTSYVRPRPVHTSPSKKHNAGSQKCPRSTTATTTSKKTLTTIEPPARRRNTSHEGNARTHICLVLLSSFRRFSCLF